MDLFITIALFILGLAMIVRGGDWFVDASIWIAKITKIPSIIIGATIVSFATTLPELIVSTSAVLKGSTDIAIGNAIGSAICNIGLVSGIILILKPMVVNKKIFGRKGLLMIGVTILFALLVTDNILNKYESIILFSSIIIFFYINLKSHKDTFNGNDDKIVIGNKKITSNAIKFILGATLIVLGSNLLVDNGITLARLINVPESIIGLTLIAFGTSLPELVTGITSVIKKDSSIGIGNILGANILDIAAILGISGFISKNDLVMTMIDVNIFSLSIKNISQTLYFDVPFLLLIMLILVLPGIITGKMYKKQGYVIVISYLVYVLTLFNLN